jgi:hypothetical protein
VCNSFSNLEQEFKRVGSATRPVLGPTCFPEGPEGPGGTSPTPPWTRHSEDYQ